MSDSILQNPLSIIGLVGASVAGPYFFANSSTPKSTLGPQQPVVSQPYNSAEVSLSGPGQLISTPPFSNQNSAVQPSWQMLGAISAGTRSGLPDITNSTPVNFVATTVSGPIFDFREVLRFDMTPNGVLHRFPRTTTVLSETQLDGMRVPFVSGTMPTDVAGTLTYYFDRRQSLRRIQMQGMMGDPSMLISLMTQYYYLKPEQTLGGYLYTTRWNNRITSLLQLKLAPVIESSDQLRRYKLFLELNQPSMEYTMSAEAAQILRDAQNSGRW